MRKLEVKPGMVFTRWETVCRAGVNARGTPTWLCKCSCGTVRAVDEDSLARGATKSCGCRRAERLALFNSRPRKTLPKGPHVIMAVTDDEYELPFLLADSVCEMARLLGINKTTVSRVINGHTERTYVKGYGYCRFVRVFVGEGEE